MVRQKYSLTLPKELVKELDPFLESAGYSLSVLIEFFLEDLLYYVDECKGCESSLVRSRRVVRAWLGRPRSVELVQDDEGNVSEVKI